MSFTIVALHHAGGSGHQYLPWRRHLPAGVQVMPINLPGRVGEEPNRPCLEISSAAEHVKQRILRGIRSQYAIFGHSMGALVAYETTRLLEERPPPLPSPPSALLVSGMAAPPRVKAAERRDLLTDEQVIARLLEMGGLDEQTATSPALSAFLPQIRADLRLVDTYRWTPGRPLSTPTWVYRGLSDRAVTADDAAGWAQVAQHVCHRVFNGGHFYIKDFASLCSALVTDLALSITHPAA